MADERQFSLLAGRLHRFALRATVVAGLFVDGLEPSSTCRRAHSAGSSPRGRRSGSSRARPTSWRLRSRAARSPVIEFHTCGRWRQETPARGDVGGGLCSWRSRSSPMTAATRCSFDPKWCSNIRWLVPGRRRTLAPRSRPTPSAPHTASLRRALLASLARRSATAMRWLRGGPRLSALCTTGTSWRIGRRRGRWCCG